MRGLMSFGILVGIRRFAVDSGGDALVGVAGAASSFQPELGLCQLDL